MSQTTFWNLLKENKIEIPIIQRDYAQGREGKEYLRQTFLESLKTALDESLKFDENQDESSEKNEVLKLDFVYGSTENGVLQPLDGQQRLTTLWLLHWYMAMRAGKLHEAGDTLKKFTYETRISSREFCEELCNASNFDSYVKYCIECKPLEKCPRKSIVDFITSQTWFYSSWKQDPTIQSMLRMLGGTQKKGKGGTDIPDGIEEVFGESSDFKKYWDKLESDNAPIVFYYLPLKDFGLSDDLYIKMNARGKQLTNFENFKADLVGYIQEKANEDETWEKFLQSENNVGIPAKLDTEWTDIFWQNKTGDGKIDEIYFVFLNRYFLHYAIANLEANENSAIWKLYGNESNDSALSYDKGFQMYADVIDKSENKDTQQENPQIETSQEQDSPKRNLLERLSASFTNLKQIVDKVVKDQTCNDIQSINDKIRSCLPEWFSPFDFIPQYKKDKGKYEVSKDSFGNNLYKVTTLNQSPRVVFFGICRYLEECKSFDEGQFKRWMRVVCNLTENNTVDTIDAMRSRIKLINELSCHCTDIYSFLSKLSDNEAKIESDAEKSDLFRFLSEIKSDAAKEQLSEEIAKAKQILKGNYDGNLAELKGKTWEAAIIEAENYAFFKGAIRFLFRNEKGEWDWKDFDTKWRNAQRYFKKECQDNNKTAINEEWDNAGLLQSLISKIPSNKFWNVLCNNHEIFNNFPKTWKYYLLDKEIYGAVHQLLYEKSPSEKELQLTENIEGNIIYYLSKTNLLDYIIRVIPNSRIRKNSSNYLAIYPPRYEGVMFDNKSESFFRNEILSSVYGGTKECLDSSMEEGKIYSSQKIDGCDFFKDWNIHFKYKKDQKIYNFRWQYNNKIEMYDGDKSLANDKKYEYLTIDGENITDKNSLIKSLNACIEKYEKLQSEQPTS